jgi:hypothetical protein
LGVDIVVVLIEGANVLLDWRVVVVVRVRVAMEERKKERERESEAL